jgi:phosphoglycerate dehydrogenase-like enzyme
MFSSWPVSIIDEVIEDAGPQQSAGTEVGHRGGLLVGVETIGKHEVVVIMRERTPFPRSVLARLPRLRLLVTTGMGNASVDMSAAAEQGVVVCGTGVLVPPTAELTWALILGLARSVPAENAALRAGGPWQQTVGTDIAGATLGVVGLGGSAGAWPGSGRPSVWMWSRGARTSPRRPRRRPACGSPPARRSCSKPLTS